MQEKVRIYHPNGRVHVEEPLRGGVLHGRYRQWHRNGVLAEEIPYKNGRRHGMGRQWNPTGQLLGECEFKEGTGVHRSWHDNGVLKDEAAMCEGRFHGRYRAWLRDGTLIHEQFYVANAEVGFARYRKEQAKDPTLPKYPERSPARVARPGRALDLTKALLFFEWVRERGQCLDFKEWMAHLAQRRRKGHLSSFRCSKAFEKWVAQLSAAGVAKVEVAGICANRHGDEFADALIFTLPKAPKARTAIRRIVAARPRPNRGAVIPESDLGQRELVVLYP